MSSPNITALRTNTLSAAQAARNAGAISATEFARMTDGTVSHVDLDTARMALAGAKGSGQEAILTNLRDAISAQKDAQGGFRTAAETGKDHFMNADYSRRIIANIK